MSREVKKLKPSIVLVARLMALGRNVEDICETYKMDYQATLRQTQSTLFKTKLQELSSEIEAKLIEEAGSDPIMLELQSHGLKAAQRLGKEVNNMEEELGAAANSRIKASNDILKRLGYSEESKQNTNPVNIVLNFNPETINRIKEKKVEGQSYNVDGVKDLVYGN